MCYIYRIYIDNASKAEFVLVIDITKHTHNAQMNKKISVEGGEMVTSIIPLMSFSTEP